MAVFRQGPSFNESFECMGCENSQFLTNVSLYRNIFKIGFSLIRSTEGK